MQSKQDYKVNSQVMEVGNRPRCCPYPKGCKLVRLSMVDNQRGYCGGLTKDIDNLDCVRLCIFKVINGEPKHLEHLMPSSEATELAKLILDAVPSNLSAK